MMFRLAALALALAPVSAYGNIRLNSPAGKKLLEKATVVEPARHLNQQNNGERDASFIATYAIKYQGCSDLVQVNREGGGNDEEGLLYTQHLVKFALCPNDSCSSCTNGGLYVVDMLEFVEAYTEAKLNEQEYKCEMIRENCYCNNYNDDERCENSCYTQAGMEVCIEYEGQEEFEVQRYLECQEMENNNGNNNNNQQNGNYNYQGNGDNYYGSYYIGPYCASDGESINLGVFYDQSCMNQADSSVFERFNYMSLPYASQSIVEVGDCVSCKDVDRDNQQNYNGNQQNGNWNGYYQDMEPNELCQRAYEDAARCEENMSINYPDTSGCEFIKNILPRMESATKPFSAGTKGITGDASTTAKVFAWIFGVTTVLFGAYAYFLYRKIKRGAVNLSSQEGSMA